MTYTHAHTPDCWLPTGCLSDLPAADTTARADLAARAADILRPAGAFARLDEAAVWLAGWQGTATPDVRKPSVLVLAGDHGVAQGDSGVSAYPAEVTRAMVAAFRADRSTVNALARRCGASVHVIDLGVGEPCGDIRTEDALTTTRAREIAAEVSAVVDGLDTDLLVIGEMGIGNTTPAAAVATALMGGTAAEWTGPGTGVDPSLVKVAAVEQALARTAGETDPLEVLRRVGGSELLGMAVAALAARRRGIPVLLDGYVVTASLLPLEVALPGALDHCFAGHVSPEPGHRKILDRLGKQPLLDLGLRLGEASGAMAAVPLLAAACASLVEVPTFAEWFAPAEQA